MLCPDDSPDSKFHISVNKTEEENLGAPLDVQHIISYFLLGASEIPKWIKIENSALCRHVFFTVFDGLDASRYDMFKEELTSFNELSKDGFPYSIETILRGKIMVPGIDTVLGECSSPRKMKKFERIQEMCLSMQDMYDNGYPIKKNFDVPKMERKCRFEFFKLSELDNEKLSEFRELPEKTENALEFIALDCEMVKTELGSELARLTCVDISGNMVIDEYFKPKGKVTDYATEVSGITEEILNTASNELSDLVDVLSKYADSNTIFIGHSLENDLRAMKLVHYKIIDTALIYNTEIRFPYKPSLSKIYQKYIKKPFRDGNNGHSSCEDAIASLELCKYALENPVFNSEFKPQIPNFFKTIYDSIATMNVFIPPFACQYQSLFSKINCIVKQSTKEIADAFIESMNDDSPIFSYSYFFSLSRCEVNPLKEKEAAIEYNDILRKIIDKLPKNSVLLVYTSNGNLKRLRGNDGKPLPNNDKRRILEFSLCRQGLLWALTK